MYYVTVEYMGTPPLGVSPTGFGFYLLPGPGLVGSLTIMYYRIRIRIIGIDYLYGRPCRLFKVFNLAGHEWLP